MIINKVISKNAPRINSYHTMKKKSCVVGGRGDEGDGQTTQTMKVSV